MGAASAVVLIKGKNKGARSKTGRAADGRAGRQEGGLSESACSNPRRRFVPAVGCFRAGFSSVDRSTAAIQSTENRSRSPSRFAIRPRSCARPPAGGFVQGSHRLHRVFVFTPARPLPSTGATNSRRLLVDEFNARQSPLRESHQENVFICSPGRRPHFNPRPDCLELRLREPKCKLRPERPAKRPRSAGRPVGSSTLHMVSFASEGTRRSRCRGFLSVARRRSVCSVLFGPVGISAGERRVANRRNRMRGRTNCECGSFIFHAACLFSWSSAGFLLSAPARKTDDQ